MGGPHCHCYRQLRSGLGKDMLVPLSKLYQLVLIGLCSAPELAVLGFHCLLRCHRGIAMDRPYDMQDAQEFFLSSRTEVWGYGEGGVVMEGWKDGDGDKGIVERLHDLHSLLCILCGISTI